MEILFHALALSFSIGILVIQVPATFIVGHIGQFSKLFLWDAATFGGLAYMATIVRSSAALMALATAGIMLSLMLRVSRWWLTRRLKSIGTH